MKKIVYVFLIAGIINISSSANAFDFTSLNNFLKNTTTKQNTQTENVNTYEALDAQINKTNTQTQNAFIDVVSLLSSAQETNDIKTQIATIMNNAKSTQTEKSSLVTQLITNYAGNLTGNKADVISTIKNMSASEKSNLINTVSTLAQSATQYLTLSKNYATALSTTTQSTQNLQAAASKIQKASATATTLKNNAAAITNLTTGITSLINQAK